MQIALALVAMGALITAGCGAAEETPSPESETTVPENSELPDGHGSMPLAVQPSGFSPAGAEANVRRYSSPPGSGCMAEVRWWRPRPSDPGGAMVVAARREVEFLGNTHEVLTTSAFDGIEQEVHVLMLPGNRVHTRLLFEGCGDAEIDRFLESVSSAP